MSMTLISLKCPKIHWTFDIQLSFLQISSFKEFCVDVDDRVMLVPGHLFVKLLVRQVCHTFNMVGQ